MISFDNVTKIFDGRRVIDGLTFSISSGEIFVIIGPSGTGKSVTLKLLSGQISPTSGTVSVLDENPSELDTMGTERLRRRVGYLFQSGALLGWMTLSENVALPLRERGKLSEAEICERVAEVLQVVGLADAGDRYPNEVSGGMQKRAGFARAIVEQPEILLFDEPTSGLDPVMSRTIDDLIVRLNRSYGITCVVVTHDLAGALNYASRIALLSSGRFVEVLEPSQIYGSKSREVQEFLKASLISEKR